ncbi:hypothetical protein QW060_25355 [Myroides ceti]|uniref:Uncharacterized protein n=1 Tax=Paenimyroides ceti TaxID=395087 RepID=A0ABT8D414_9FLAO|nr:hypothetical protein [Paenimyroides ceti]MDN3710200.1 hypothetical protein [Paenimyroides ceti]
MVSNIEAGKKEGFINADVQSKSVALLSFQAIGAYAILVEWIAKAMSIALI